MSEQPQQGEVWTELTITVKDIPGTGLMASLTSDGAMSDPGIDRRFYFIHNRPPADLRAYEFWGSLLIHMGRFLADSD